jgi:hypothetical protein
MPITRKLKNLLDEYHQLAAEVVQEAGCHTALELLAQATEDVGFRLSDDTYRQDAQEMRDTFHDLGKRLEN